MKVALAHAYALSGKKPEARKILSELLAESRRQYFPLCAIAVIYTALGEKTQLWSVWNDAAKWRIYLIFALTRDLTRCGQTGDSKTCS